MFGTKYAIRILISGIQRSLAFKWKEKREFLRTVSTSIVNAVKTTNRDGAKIYRSRAQSLL